MPNTISGLDVLTPTPDTVVASAPPAVSQDATMAGALPAASQNTAQNDITKITQPYLANFDTSESASPSHNTFVATNAALALMRNGYDPTTVKQYIFDLFPNKNQLNENIGGYSAGDYLASKIDAYGYTLDQTGMGTNASVANATPDASRLNPFYQYLVDPNLVGRKIENPTPSVDVSQYGRPDMTKEWGNDMIQQGQNFQNNLSQVASTLSNNDPKSFNDLMRKQRYSIADIFNVLGIPRTPENFKKYHDMGFQF
jgi:hypothetical protein